MFCRIVCVVLAGVGESVISLGLFVFFCCPDVCGVLSGVVYSVLCVICGVYLSCCL